MSNGARATPLWRPGRIRSRVLAFPNFLRIETDRRATGAPRPAWVNRAGGSQVRTDRRCRHCWLCTFLLAGAAEQPLGNHIVLGDPQDLVEGCLALDRLNDPILEQGA